MYFLTLNECIRLKIGLYLEKNYELNRFYPDNISSFMFLDNV